MASLFPSGNLSSKFCIIYPPKVLLNKKIMKVKWNIVTETVIYIPMQISRLLSKEKYKIDMLYYFDLIKENKS